MHELNFVLPEAILVIMACIALLASVSGSPRSQAFTFGIAVFAVLVVLAGLVLTFPTHSEDAFNGTFRTDALASALKMFLMGIVLCSFFYAREYFMSRGRLMEDFSILALFASFGMMVLISAHSLLTVYLGLELLSLSLYAMVAMDRDSVLASEAAIKYFVLGALASGMLLYGMSMLYGVTGSLDLSAISKQTIAAEEQLLFVFGLVFLLIGIAFKFGVAPFHMWVPDVYQGAPTPVTLFVSSAPKLAAFAMALRLLADSLSGLSGQWQQMVLLLAVASMAIGNIVAIAQTNMKRMLAYSTIAHMGYVFLGILTVSSSGYAASMFYVIVYALMSMGAFGAIIILASTTNESEQLQDFTGLATRSPWVAFVVLILMFSLAGVPPFAGFWAKWFVLKEVVATGHTWLAAIAVFFSLIGAYYYLRVVKLMYFDRVEVSTAIPDGTAGGRIVFGLNGLTVLVLGLFPGALMSMCLAVMLTHMG